MHDTNSGIPWVMIMATLRAMPARLSLVVLVNAVLTTSVLSAASDPNWKPPTNANDIIEAMLQDGMENELDRRVRRTKSTFDQNVRRLGEEW